MDRAVAASLLAAALNLTLMLTAPRLPFAVLAPSILALSVAIAFPVLQVAMVDLFPHHRGAAASLASFASLMFNALLAGVISPLITGSLAILAGASAALSRDRGPGVVVAPAAGPGRRGVGQLTVTLEPIASPPLLQRQSMAAVDSREHPWEAG